jgi:hypothetical protein
MSNHCPECGAEEPYWDARCADPDSAEAEIKRLRGALRLIAEQSDEDDEWDGRDKFLDVRAFARRVLEHNELYVRLAGVDEQKT